ncbi:GntR family transcriptional regulator [Alkalimonas collagenimarina]|uniref:GntR family transcriptional regulator n=1 Tax=Alkalimonas collagenimarina TaxID=400390 RepID=A0ABT9GUB9_9GAMM|nr:GntR family transcriptional regulator [Alkalimonas collagenimarina]MDP4534642.1 GntR family transcriptional regulator [Alkalimonas collagenimarina]
MAVEYKTRTQVVVEEIRKQILTGQIKAGEPLRQAALAEKLNVSRIPVREALLQLEAEGLVEFEAHKGATATRLSAEQVTELFELRALLECDLLRRAIPLMTDVVLKAADRVRMNMTVAFEKSDEISSWSDLNTEFHLTLYRPAGRHKTIELVHNLMINSDRYIRFHLLLAGGVTKADPEHHALLQLCQAKDIDGACQLLRKHILEAADEINDILVRSEKS